MRECPPGSWVWVEPRVANTMLWLRVQVLGSMMSLASNSSTRFFNGSTSWHGTRRVFCAISFVLCGFIGILI